MMKAPARRRAQMRPAPPRVHGSGYRKSVRERRTSTRTLPVEVTKPRPGRKQAESPGRHRDGDRGRNIEDLEDDNIFIYAMRYASEEELIAFIGWLRSAGILTEGEKDG